jgi:hypothetical protein
MVDFSVHFCVARSCFDKDVYPLENFRWSFFNRDISGHGLGGFIRHLSQA